MHILPFFCQFCRMPLFLQQVTKESAKLGIWHITETLEELLRLKKFSPRDLEVLGTFAYEHRKKEWLAARILTEELTGSKEAQIIYDEHNKPSLKGSDQFISLSHSHNLLTVILDNKDTGIDIELLKTKVISIKEKFMSEEELNSMQKENESEQLTVYWCSKEALYKLYGKKELTFKENLVVEPFKYSRQGIIKGWIKKGNMNSSYLLQYENLSFGSQQYMLAYVINQV